MESPEPVVFGAESVAPAYRTFLEPALFGPWAQRLVEFARLQPRQVVLDVAAGTGAVARAAAAAVGRDGAVVASDVSAQMLAQMPDVGVDAAPITPVVGPATVLPLPDESVDVVLCQQGLPFIAERDVAVGEMRRVLRPGGTVAVAVWWAEDRVEPFATYADAVRRLGLAEPFPGAFDPSSLAMSLDQVEELLSHAGLDDIEVITTEMPLRWPSPEAAARGIAGTPFGSVLARESPAAQRDLLIDVTQAFTAMDGGVLRHQSTAVLGRALAGRRMS